MTYHHSEDEPLFRRVNLSISQGKLVAVMGSHGSGKATLGNLLAGDIFPLEGQIFVPMHLRVLRVSSQPVLLDKSAWKNLTFGCPEAAPEIVLKILADLHSPELVDLVTEELVAMGLLESSEKRLNTQPAAQKNAKDDWQDALSHTEKVKIHLARALIMNAEMMVLLAPLHHFDHEGALRVLAVLRSHIACRGLYMPSESCHIRRPRTCFFTVGSGQIEAAQHADVVWKINKEDKSVSAHECAGGKML
eukprot:gnl/TRDRNA2_/TRDRNA2_211881_c0_seq1.p1 gnl/TRDRNA2_/TRDRNA2_211881_c0~~gnl/TRDRNA2_/TRDRNA2_211881_c0_seq1.p1  ORF type:complete len:267 (+),score=54.45 gnl/TRDRNA2_/TRDRNA2_211881_c0_seq1:59-802(+)